MSKPILDNINAFDINIGTTVTFSTENQIWGSRINIYSYNDLNSPIYSFENNGSQQLFYVIPASSILGNNMKNGNSYYMEVITTEQDEKNNRIEFKSDKVLFWCYSKPEFKLSIYQENDIWIVKNSMITLNVLYNTNDDETCDKLNTYYIEFYDEKKNKISDSGEQYGVNIKDYSYTVNSLEDQKYYYFRAFGTTVNGMSLDTGFNEIHVLYSTGKSSFLLSLENDFCNGQIVGNVYINANHYSLMNPNVEYEDNTYIDLRYNKLQYDDGLRLGKDFSMYTVVKDIEPNTTFLCLDDKSENQIFIKYLIHEIYERETIDKTQYNVIAYQPYFSVVTNDNRVIYNTSMFEPIGSLEELQGIRYEIKFSKVSNIINIRIKQLDKFKSRLITDCYHNVLTYSDTTSISFE